MRRLVTLLALVNAVAAQAFVFGPERAITHPTLHALGGQLAPRIASSGDGFLAIWTDYRGESADLFATRFDSDGRVLDPTGIALGIGPVSALTWSGRKYIVIRPECGAFQVTTIDRDGNVGPTHDVEGSSRECEALVSLVSNGQTILAVTTNG